MTNHTPNHYYNKRDDVLIGEYFNSQLADLQNFTSNSPRPHATATKSSPANLQPSRSAPAEMSKQPDGEPKPANGSVPTHAQANAVPYLELEIRQDLIDSTHGQHEWAERLARLLPAAWHRFAR